MAFKQNLVQRLFNLYNNKFSNQTLKTLRISSSSSTLQSIIPQNPDAVTPESEKHSLFRRFLHRRPLYLTYPALPEVLRPGGEKLMERLREIDIARNRIRFQKEGQLTVTEARKVLMAAKMEALKLKLKRSRENQVSYDEFVRMCVDECCDEDQGVDLAKVLDDSGTVIVIGNIVFLKPEQVVKALNEVLTGDEIPTKELEQMEQWKSEIDEKAKKMVRRELWGGLGYLMVQTAVFMRLTFWELSWDVMEPICFYVTSLYFMIGYAYFIRTSREPSFEAVFKSRFGVKQMKVMKMQGFDVERYNELKRSCGSRDRPRRRDGGCCLEQVYDDDDVVSS